MNFENDPLLNYPTTQSMQGDSDVLMKRLADLQRREQVINMQAQVSSTPLWDEIDKIEDGLTDTQKQFLAQNREYVDSYQFVSKLVQDEELRIIRPRIERTEQGKEALKKHLSIIQRLKKDMAREEEQRNAMLNDYLTNHPDMTYKEYVAMINGKGGRE